MDLPGKVDFRVMGSSASREKISSTRRPTSRRDEIGIDSEGDERFSRSRTLRLAFNAGCATDSRGSMSREISARD